MGLADPIYLETVNIHVLPDPGESPVTAKQWIEEYAQFWILRQEKKLEAISVPFSWDTTIIEVLRSGPYHHHFPTDVVVKADFRLSDWAEMDAERKTGGIIFSFPDLFAVATTNFYMVNAYIS